MSRCLLSLDGLSVGDAFGERSLEQPDRAEYWIQHRQSPPPPWGFTDIGGVVALSADRDSIPPEWLKAREPFTV